MIEAATPSDRAEPLSRRFLASAAWTMSVAVWGTVLALCLILAVVGFQMLLRQARAGLVFGEGVFGISQDVARTLIRARISQVALARWIAIGQLVGWSLFALTGLVIYVLKPKDRGAFVTSLMLLSLGSALLLPMALIRARRPELVPAVAFIGQAASPWPHFGRSIAGISSLAALLLLPDGRFVPKFSRWLLLFMVTYAVLWAAVPGVFAITTFPAGVQLLWVWGLPLVGVAAQIYRYVKVSTKEERWQTRLVLGSVFVGAAVFTLLIVLDPDLGEGILDLGLVTPELVAFYEVLLLILLGAAVVFLPLSIGWSVMRRQLFDVRFLINRALVYTLLTALLVGMGLAAVFLSSRALGLLLGEVVASDLALVGSTVVITLMFGPARRWAQGVIDRAFDRGRYDAALIMEGISRRLGTETSLESVATELVSTIDEAMSPRSIRVWLRSTDPNA
ncbi:MAG TPA: hypothetical protein VFZ06_10830 [Acidimicrobiia bacterium]|nr:hypothetical protein [Acidimicrobiia bacterium]